VLRILEAPNYTMYQRQCAGIKAARMICDLDIFVEWSDKWLNKETMIYPNKAMQLRRTQRKEIEAALSEGSYSSHVWKTSAVFDITTSVFVCGAALVYRSRLATAAVLAAMKSIKFVSWENNKAWHMNPEEEQAIKTILQEALKWNPPS
jgi:hypothetical protein